MSKLAFVVTTQGQIEEICSRLTEAIKPAGFGVLTRIDFDKKIKEKTGMTIKPCLILGACNPALAYEAYAKSSDVALLIPCNIVLTEVEPNKIKIEAMRPTQMLNMLPALKLTDSVETLEEKLKQALRTIAPLDE